MFKKLTLAGAALAMGTVALAPTEAAAQRYYGDRYERGYYGNNAYRDYRGNDRRYDRRAYRDDRRSYRDNRCNSGTTGTILGAVAGGLLGRAIDTRGDRLPGTLLGGAAGALAGRAVEKSDNPRYCR